MSAAAIQGIFEPSISGCGVQAAFAPRMRGIDVSTDRATALARLRNAHKAFLRGHGFDPAHLATAEQVHGSCVSVAVEPVCHKGTDALVTEKHGLALGIHVADCAAVYLADRRGRAIGLAHSGRAGSEANIVGKTITMMKELFGIAPEDLVVELSPCIRPPLYETDFAALIARQARAEGVSDVRDRGICTGSDVGGYYSHRMEHGQTGRMLAVLALRP